MRKVCVSDHQGSDRQGDTPLDLCHRQGHWYICIFCLLHLSDIVIAHRTSQDRTCALSKPMSKK